MCNLNKLRNTVYSKKLIHFLEFYPHIVFYHSNKGNALRKCPQVLKNGEKVLFLANCRRLRKFSVQRKNSGVADKWRLHALSKAGITGNSFLIGCNSCRAMQKIIKECKDNDPLNYICLGGIQGYQYLDHRDCLRLTEINDHHGKKTLINTLGGAQKTVLLHLQRPLLHLFHILQLYSRKNS